MEIRAELEDLSSIKKVLRVEIPAEVAQQELNRVAKDYCKYARLPGFRPGKAPVSLVKRRFEKDIRQDVLQKLIPESYDQAVKEKGLKPLGRPDLEKLVFEEGKPLSYEARFEVGPVVKLPAYKGLTARAERSAITEEEINLELQKLRDRHSRLVTVEGRPVQEGDYALVDLHGVYVSDQAAETSTELEAPAISEENAVLQVGDSHTLKEFNEALPRMQLGEEKTFLVSYPSDYPNKKLAGQSLLFTVQLNELKVKQLPELNDEFAKDASDFATMGELKEKIRADLEAQHEKNRESALQNDLLKQLVETADFELPEILVEDRIDEKLRDVAYNIAAQGVDPSKANVDWTKVRSDLRPEAERDVRVSIILEEIANQENLQVESRELEGEIERLAASMNQPIEKVRQYFQKEGRMENLRRQLLSRKALDLVFSAAVIS
ncbi:MAG: trigger factor [Acidobacteria bacterium]|nr:trigger factor [Acidobacteriota bacterium]